MTLPNASTMLTHSGKHLDVQFPSPDDICVEDVAMGLASEIRFSGQITEPWTVAQHSVMVSIHAQYLASGLGLARHLQAVALAGLIHDASEAYLRDLCSPLKGCLPEYKVVEHKMMHACTSALVPPAIMVGVPANALTAVVKQADWNVFSYEARRFYPRTDLSDWGLSDPQAYADVAVMPAFEKAWTRGEAYDRFVKFYHSLLRGKPWE